MKHRREVKKLVVIVTGSSSGIGRATALEIAGAGGSVVLVSRQECALRELAIECRSRGGQTLAIATDVTDESAVAAMVGRVIGHFGRIDALVNNAAVTAFGGIEEVPMEVYRRVIETNLIGYVHCIRAVLPHFRDRGAGTIVNVSSVISKAAQPFTSAYSVSKCAINGLSDGLRAEMVDIPGIHVCTVLPPSVDTPIFQHGANLSGRQVKPMQPTYPATKVAAAIVSALEKPKREVHIGRPGALLTVFRTLVPGISERLFSRKVRSDHFTSRPAEASWGNLMQPDTENNAISGGWLEQPEGRRRRDEPRERRR